MFHPHAPNRISIDYSALQSNFRTVTERLAPSCQPAAVVKADAYGIGVETAVPALEKAGARFFYVAHFAEALEVRALTSLPIAVLGGLPKGAAREYKENKIIPVLNSEEDIDSCPADLPAIWHIDTGMNRLGLPCSDVSFLTSTVKAMPLMLMTHFTSSEDPDTAQSLRQINRFDSCIAGLPKPFQILPQSISNSSGIFRNEEWHRSQVRPGIALYGGNPTPETVNPMKAVVGWDAKILQIRKASAGETIGYNCTETLANDTTLATLGIGYADGFFRTGSSKAKAYWHGHPCRILGRISMDLVVVDLGKLPQDTPPPRQGDWLEILGSHQSLDTLASDLGTISYEVLTSLSRRAEKSVKI